MKETVNELLEIAKTTVLVNPEVHEGPRLVKVLVSERLKRNGMVVAAVLEAVMKAERKYCCRCRKC